MSLHTLVLTPWMSPHRVVHWENAICLLYTNKVEVLEEYDEILRSPSIEMRVPSVVRLKKAVASVKRGVKFSRVNVLTRDHYQCQYCGRKLSAKELNYDHVIPRIQGGKTCWENIVAACAGPHGCNAKKAGRTPQQAGMKLLKQPTRPKVLPMSLPMLPQEVPELWHPYLQASMQMTA